MAQFEVRFHKSVPKDLDDIPKRDAERILLAIRGLANDPRPPQSQKMVGVDKYRLRCGVYRVVYEIQDAVLVVYVVRVAHRKDVYRN